MTTQFFGDMTVLLGRSLRHISRSPDTIITTAIMPIAFMLLFVYVFGGAFISSAFVPADTVPGAVRDFAENQPVTSIVDTIRDVFTQQPVGTGIWTALAWWVGILVVACGFATATYRRKIS